MPRGSLALTFDDAYVEDDEQIRPVLDERSVPASLAVTPEFLGPPDNLTPERLAELADDGWEVMAHGRRHRYLGTHRLAADAAPGDERVALDSGHVFPGEDHGVYPGDEFEVTDGIRAEAYVLAGKSERDGTPTMTFETALDADFAAGETVVRPAESQIRDEVVGAGEGLRERGFEPSTFVFPYDAADPRAWQLAADRYDAVADAVVRSLPNPPGTPPSALGRYYLETDALTMVEIETYLDAVAETGGVGILAGHTAWETVPPERVAAVVDAAFERDVQVTTVRDAVE
ncbi:MAG: polysaccharide deacetylase family protein [Haloarculaceae archaeon]